MRKIIRYLPSDKKLIIACRGMGSMLMTVLDLIQEGMGDHTVESDGLRMYVTKEEFERLASRNNMKNEKNNDSSGGTASEDK